MGTFKSDHILSVFSTYLSPHPRPNTTNVKLETKIYYNELHRTLPASFQDNYFCFDGQHLLGHIKVGIPQRFLMTPSKSED